MMRVTVRTIGMVFFSLCAASANALTMISCGASEGHAYVVEGGFVPSGKGGWIIDGISGGKFEAVKEGKEYDIRYYDATQRAYSARHDDGATVIALKDEPAALVILIVYPDLGAGSTTEVFQFRPLDKEVVWMQMKVGPVNKTAVFHAPCD